MLRGGFGIFHPTGAAQGARDIMSRNPFRYTITRKRPQLQHGFTTGTGTESLGFGNQGLALDLESPDIYQYNLTLERELPGDLGLRVSYLGSTMRKLLVHRDYNTRAGERRAARQRRRGSGRPRAAAVSDLRHVHGHHREQRRGPVQRAAARAAAPIQGAASR